MGHKAEAETNCSQVLGTGRWYLPTVKLKQKATKFTNGIINSNNICDDGMDQSALIKMISKHYPYFSGI